MDVAPLQVIYRKKAARYNLAFFSLSDTHDLFSCEAFNTTYINGISCNQCPASLGLIELVKLDFFWMYNDKPSQA